MSVCPLDPHSSDFGDVCASYAPFLHRLTMQSSLFEPERPVLVVVCVARKLRPCPSYSRRRDRINLGLWRSLYKGGGVHIYRHTGRPSGVADSHNVFLRGLCHRSSPEFVLLLAAGTVPRDDGLYRLYAALREDRRLGGCCGELVAEHDWGNPIVMAQCFEYKVCPGGALGPLRSIGASAGFYAHSPSPSAFDDGARVAAARPFETKRCQGRHQGC